MRNRSDLFRVLRVSAAALALVACNSDSILTPAAPSAGMTPHVFQGASLQGPPPSVRFSEIHYDNVSTDQGEAIEISGPAGTNVTGWKIVLYNGANAAASPTYTPTVTLSGTIPATCGTRGVIVTTYAVNGIQNGDPDGFALVDNNNNVIEFLAYGTTTTAMVASNGPAAGMTATDIGVKEGTNTPVGFSLQRTGDNVWHVPAANTFGACNDEGAVQPPAVATVEVSPAAATISVGATQQFTATAYDASHQAISGATFTWASSAATVATVNGSGLATGTGAGDATISATSGSATGSAALHVNGTTQQPVPDIRVSEIHYDNSGTDAGEAIEIEGPINTTLTNWSLVLYDGNGGVVYNTVAINGTLTGTCNNRGVLSIDIAGIQNGSPDGFALVDGNGVVVEFLSYEGSFTATAGAASGMVSTDIGVSEPGTGPTASSLSRSADGTSWNGPAASTFGYVNACGGPAPSTKTITFSGRTATDDPPLPVGFEAQIFGTEKDNGATVTTTITWSSDTPAIATIDQNGVFRALAAGTAILRATATDGTTATYPLPTVVATQGGTYSGNTEFGDPVDGDASDDFIIRKPEFTTSFNHNKGTPNWVSHHLSQANYGAQDRCNCFTFDQELIDAGFPRYTTADYTGAGAAAGYGIDRGHMTRSSDRTAGNLDNATTYYFSNVVPQAADLNQGPWAIMENYLGDLARDNGKEVYVIVGPSGNKGTVKSEGKIVIPTKTWKVAVIMDHGKGLADVHSVSDLQVIAVIMPNDAGVRNVDWHTYITTVDAVEALTGYDLLTALPDNIERAVESGDTPPVAAISGSTSGAEGSSLSFSASGSSDADAGDALSYSWTFGDGGTGTGLNTTHTYADNGSFTVTLTVTDSHGVTDTKTMTVPVSNVAPAISSVTGPSSAVNAGTNTGVSVQFSDAGSADTHSATFAWGDGGSTTVNAGSATSASSTHSYAAAGFYTVTVTVADDDGASVASTTTVIVYSAAAGYPKANGWMTDGQYANTGGGAAPYFNFTLKYSGATPVGTFLIRNSQKISNLTSSSFEYLVVSGARATFRGIGTLADGTPVSFVVSGEDDTTDKIRITVKNRNTGAILLDTQANAPDSAAPTSPISGFVQILH